MQRLASSGIPGVEPPGILIFFHIPKTGGITMDGVLEHCFPNQCFHAHIREGGSALLVRSTARIAEKFRLLPVGQQNSVRCLMGIHVAMDVGTIFSRPAKFFTIVRHPVDRAISNFFYNRTQSHLTSYPYIRNMTLEQYLDSGIGLDAHNHQVRMLSGCPELDAPWDPRGGRISTVPVEPRHLELAKRNIEERFVIAAPLEQFTALVWFIKRLYGVPLNRVIFRKQNATEGRPRVAQVSAATRQRLTEWNRYDIDLYEWVRGRFAQQIRSIEPEFSVEVGRFEMLNYAAQRLHNVVPFRVRRLASRLLYSARAA